LKIQVHLTLLLVLFLVLFTHSAVSGEDSMPVSKTDQGKEQTVFYIDIPDREEAGSSNFKPGEITVKTGDKIVWTNHDKRTHFITSMNTCDYPGSNCNETADESEDDEEEEVEEEERENNPESDKFHFTSSYLEKGKTFSFAFSKAGVYKYYCYTHPLEMKGTIIVEE
jgi:plastocyanin